MQCRTCGSPINETDTVCKVCGAVQQEKKPIHNEEFQWTVHDFSKPKKASPDLKMEWPREPERPRRSKGQEEPISFDIDVFKKRGADGNSMSENMPKGDAPQDDTKKAEPTAEAKQPTPEVKQPTLEVRQSPTAELTPEQKLRELVELTEKLKRQSGLKQEEARAAMNSFGVFTAEQAREESLRKADPYFDFSKTNIAFQDLLDQEYEKLQKRKEGVPYVESQWRYEPEKEPEKEAEREVSERSENGPELPESPEDALERMIREGTKSVEAGEDSTIQVDLSAIKKAAAKHYGYESEEDAGPEAGAQSAEPAGSEAGAQSAEPAGSEVGAQAIEPEQKEQAPTEEKEEPPTGTEDTPVQKFRKRDTMTEMERAREEYFRMLDREMGGVQVKVEVNTPYGQAGKVVTDVDIKSGGAAESKKSHAPVYEETADGQSALADHAEAEKRKDVGVETTDTAESTERTDVEATDTTEPTEQAGVQTPEEDAVWPLDPREYEEEPEKGGCAGAIGKFLLAIILLVIVLELAALGILYLAPDSSAADKVSDVQGKVMDFIDSVKERGSAILNGDEEEQDAVQEDGASSELDQQEGGDGEISTLPMEDKEALIGTQLDLNKNIRSITANDALVFRSSVDYGNDDLNSSQPIDNNLWYIKEDGTPVYYDQEVVGALIAFNSQWVDYVNSGDKSALNVTKEGSRAYENAVGFSKVGKVTEEFLSLEIGEVRKGQQGFYLWANEEIQLTENGSTATASYQWVYYMEPVGNEMKIVDYINIKNK